MACIRVDSRASCLTWHAACKAAAGQAMKSGHWWCFFWPPGGGGVGCARPQGQIKRRPWRTVNGGGGRHGRREGRFGHAGSTLSRARKHGRPVSASRQPDPASANCPLRSQSPPRLSAVLLELARMERRVADMHASHVSEMEMLMLLDGSKNPSSVA